MIQVFNYASADPSFTGKVTFEPLPPGDTFGDLMNAPKKYVVSRTLEKPTWRNTTIIRDDVVAAVRKLKAAPGKGIITDDERPYVTYGNGSTRKKKETAGAPDAS